MELAQSLFGTGATGKGPAVVAAIVGAGGKTSALFALGAELSRRFGECRDGGGGEARARVLLTTTTSIIDPRGEQGRSFDRLLFAPSLAEGVWTEGEALPDELAAPLRGVTVLASHPLPGGPKLKGIARRAMASLMPLFDYILVEADGSRGHPVKAPAAHEPAMPDVAGLVIGLVGLDCIGEAMDARTVHRSELFGPLVGLAPGEPIGAGHLAGLVSSRDGLFKSAPATSRRALILNKAELLGPVALAALVSAIASALPSPPARGLAPGPGGECPGPLDLILACSLAAPSRRVLAHFQNGAMTT